MSTLDEVAEDFRLAIADLTSPARHIITSLTSIAAEQTDFAPAIVEVIEERIRKAAPKHLLPTLYLLDSVVKNVGGVYIELFAKNLYGIVTLALKRSVDDAKAQKAIPRMIGTWHGVFSEDLVALLEKYLSSSTQAPTSKQPSMPMYTQQQPIPFYPVPQVPPPIQQPAMFPQPNLSHVQSILDSLAGANAFLAPQQQLVPPPATHHQQHRDNRHQDYRKSPVTAKQVAFDLSKVTLDNASLARRYENAMEALYGNLKLQCQQCGFRYADNPDGNEKMSAHLDWHYRQNRRNQEYTKTSHSRDWFLTEIKWVETRDIDTTSNQAPVFDTDAQQDKADLGAADTSHNIPLNEELGRTCHVCQEQIEVFWDTEEDEWLMRDAVEHEGKVYHRSCFESESNSVAASPVATTMGHKRKLSDDE